MSGSDISARRWNQVLAVGGILSGVIGFFIGRFTVQPTATPEAVRIAQNPIPPAAVSNDSTRKRIFAPVIEAPALTNQMARSPGWDENQWERMLSRPGSPARQAALAALLEELATADPDRAMSLAQAEGNLKVRETLVQSALRGWARTSPTNAAAWALALSDSNDRERALSMVFAGAVAANPDAAVHLGKSLFQQNPADAAGCGSSLIAALCDGGNFETAARLAAEGGPDIRSGWMANAFSRWAEFQPAQAAQAASAITDAETRNEALHGIIGGWAEADPMALVQFVTRLPPDAERGSILSQALENWVKHDPEAASGWINEHDAGPDLDEGIAAVAGMDSIKPDVAIGWAESVGNPKLRSETLVTVIRNWLTVDLPAAKHYFESSKNLLPDDRQELTEVFDDFSKDSAKP